jgi:hypothetical protein
MRTSREQFPTQKSRASAMMNHSESDISADAPARGPTAVYEMSHDDDLESCMEISRGGTFMAVGSAKGDQ